MRKVTLTELDEREAQAARDRLAAEADRQLRQVHDWLQHQSDRKARVGKTPDCEAFVYVARNDVEHTGRAALDWWAEDLEDIISEARGGTLDPAAELPTPPGAPPQ